MKSSTSTRPKPDDVKPEEIARSVAGGVAQIDSDRAAAYAGLGTLRATQDSALDREERLLARKYGDKHPRVLAVETRRAANAVFQRDLAVAHAAAATPAPGVDPTGYVFHGHVRNGRRQPLPKLTVALYDEKGEWVSEMGYGCTDDAGYFLLRHQRDTKTPGTTNPDTPPKQDPAAPPANPTVPSPGANPGVTPVLTRAAAATSSFSTRAAATNTSRVAIEIRVYDASQKLLHREEEPLRPVIGTIDYREIIICEKGTCTPPPGAPNQPPPTTPTTPTTPTPNDPTVPPRSASATSTPLENIKGIGPARATALRNAGITDVETLLQTPTEKLVGIAGFDADVVKSEAQKTLRAAQKKSPR